MSMTHTCGLCTGPLVYLHDVFPEFAQSVLVDVKTADFCLHNGTHLTSAWLYYLNTLTLLHSKVFLDKCFSTGIGYI